MRLLTASTPTPLVCPPIVKRFWKGASLVGIFVLVVLIGNLFISPDRAVGRKMLGHDFLPFYFAGTCAREGRLDKLYDLEAAKQFEFKLGAASELEMGKGFGPWWNPPLVAWIFAPLAALPYQAALTTWWSINLAALAVSMLLLARMLPDDWRYRGLVPLLMLTTMPLIQALSHGQNTFLSLLLLTITVKFWRDAKPLTAGLVAGLLFYKPQLGAVVALVLCLSRGRRALLGVAITGTALLLLNILTMPGTLGDFVFRLPENLRFMQEQHAYLWDRHVTFKSFWRLLLQGKEAGATSIAVKSLWVICEMIWLAGLAMAIAAARRARSAVALDRLIAAAIVSMPLLMPFYFDYDLLLVSVAAVVYAADRLRGDLTPEDRWLPIAWAALYLSVEVATPIASVTRFHPTIPILAILSGLLIRRAMRGDSVVSFETRAMDVGQPMVA